MVGPAVLVLDGDQRSALAVVRSLGRRGCTVHVGAPMPRSLAGGSRFAASESILPSALDGSFPYAAKVADLVGRHRVDIVLPMADAATLALLEHPRLLGEVCLPSSDLQHFRRASDKEAVLGLASQLGIAVPAQWTISTDLEAVSRIPLEQYPVIVKPARSVAGPEGRRRKVGVLYAHSPATLEAGIRQLGADAGPFLVQARIQGPGVGIFLLRWKGAILATFAHRRIREKPPSGGVSTCCESVAAPEDLLTQSRALLEALHWTGVAMVEYKQDVRSGRYYLMEINPRFWGSLQLAIDSGVDFPWYLVQAALGHSPEPVTRWQTGRRSRWIWGEVDHLIARLRHPPARLNLPTDDPGLLRTALSALLPWRPGQRNDVFRLTDPKPFLRESIAWLQAL